MKEKSMFKMNGFVAVGLVKAAIDQPQEQEIV